MPDYWNNSNEEAWERRRDRWRNDARCCIRAGLGIAVEGGSGMGVMGFTAGDVRKIYGGKVPEWIVRQWDQSEVIGVKAIVPGIGFIPEVVGRGETFEQMDNEAMVWL